MGGSGGFQGTDVNKNGLGFVEPAGTAIVTFPPTNTSVRGG